MTALLILHDHNQAHWRSLLAAMTCSVDRFEILQIGDQALEWLPEGGRQWWQLTSPPLAATEQMCQAIVAGCQQLGWPIQQLMMGNDLLSRELLPQLAQQWRLPMLTDVSHIEVTGTDVADIASPSMRFLRPAWAGKIQQHWRTDEGCWALTLQPSYWVMQGESLPLLVPPLNSGQKWPVAVLAQERSQRQWQPLCSERPNLATATTVIGIGRGVDTTLLPLVMQLADRLGAAIGGTRAVIDGGLLPAHLQIGQTGQAISPQRYLALGISGADQHLQGIQQAQQIIAVDRDGQTPLMQLADYALVGDLAEVLADLLADANPS
ncbi:MAG: FAD-binding protein [Ferrimonas sp.]